MDKELQTHIETYVRERAETLNIRVDTLQWTEEVAPVPGTALPPALPVFTLRVTIEGRQHSLTFTEEECHAVGLPEAEDHGAEAWPRMREKIDELLGALAPKKPRFGY